jgi:hypothetical protein
MVNVLADAAELFLASLQHCSRRHPSATLASAAL